MWKSIATHSSGKMPLSRRLNALRGIRAVKDISLI
jgi:hypothetical protein